MGLDLGVLIADAQTASRAVTRASELAAAENTHFFVMSSGVTALAVLGESANHGAEITVCATDAAAYHIAATDWPGVVWGSQYDHARLLRDAPRFLADTGGQQSYLSTSVATRPIVVEITTPLSTPKADQALRTAIAYLGADLQASVMACVGPSESDAPLPTQTQKKIHYLRAREAFMIASVKSRKELDSWITW